MREHRYILEKYKTPTSRYRCPGCQQRDKTFSLYIDTENGEHINPTVGRCNRESNCGYHYTPKQYFEDNNISFDTPQPKPYTKIKVVTPQQKIISFIPVEIFKKSLQYHNENNFVKFLYGLFGTEITNELISKYFIGTSKYWNGATVFWQVDINGRVRTGKIMLYSPITGKRIKEPNHISWVHKAMKLPTFELRQCLFGEHLLHDKTKPVAIVESEKTAIIADIYLPQFIWLAVGSLTNLNAEKCSVLIGRKVILFPDLNGFEKWDKKAKELSHIANFIVSDLLEQKATEAEKKQGFDLADYLIKFDYKDFQQQEENTLQRADSLPQHTVNPCNERTQRAENNLQRTESQPQQAEIAELGIYFKGTTLSTLPIKLSQCETITDIPKFIESHFAIVKANTGKRILLPYLNRLKDLKLYLTTNLY